MSRGADTVAAADPFDAGWSRRPPTRSNYVRDAVGAGVLLLATVISVLLYTSAGFPDAAHPVVSAHWAVALTLPLAFRRRFPATVAIVLAVVYTLGLVLQVPESLFNQICLFLAIYTVGAWAADRRRALAVRLLIAIAMLGWLITSLVSGDWLDRALPATEAVGPLSPYLAESALVVLVNLLYFGSATSSARRRGSRLADSRRWRRARPSSTTSASAPRAGPSPRSGCGSPASCTTSWRTTSA
ncbi:DUF7134 domain-containing protein [Rathayibacter sp. VKM Ac-2630]|uniref:DUF7134 domain-containing protein n=1 Tax=Rathayibacter sp. VKM Ac-2630 TaxID=1938617 RepID=UPI0011159C9F|nr:hypothetical protein [Rathayibacter sp. VKM Ac-2630]